MHFGSRILLSSYFYALPPSQEKLECTFSPKLIAKFPPPKQTPPTLQSGEEKEGAKSEQERLRQSSSLTPPPSATFPQTLQSGEEKGGAKSEQERFLRQLSSLTPPSSTTFPHVGVGMVVRAERGLKYPVVSKIIPDGAAAENSKIRVGDELLQVDGVSCAGKRAEVLVCLVLPALWAVSACLRTCTLIRRL